MHGVLKEICRASLIEPTYEEFEDAGIRLTDDQMMAIFSYSQKGVKALESFRQKPGNLNGNWTGKGVPKNASRNNKLQNTYDAYCFNCACLFIINKMKDGEKPNFRNLKQKICIILSRLICIKI